MPSSSPIILAMLAVLSHAPASVNSAIDAAHPVTVTATAKPPVKPMPAHSSQENLVVPPETGDDNGDEVVASSGDEEYTTQEDSRAPSSVQNNAGEKKNKNTKKGHGGSEIEGVPADIVRKFDQIAQCESGGNWSINTGNGFAGGLQMQPSTFKAFGGEQYGPSADKISREDQIKIAYKILQSQSWNAWPSCSAKYGFSGYN